MADKKSSRYSVDLTTGPILKTLMVFSLPIIAGSIVQQLYNVADSVIVGRLIGKAALAAVSASAPVMTIINMVLIGLSSGATVVIAQIYGTRNSQLLNKATGAVASLTLISSLTVTLIGVAVSKSILRFMDTPDDIFAASYQYLLIIFLGTTGNLIYNMGSGVLRGMGDSMWSFVFLLVCSVLNIVLDLIAVTLLNWGVMGAAIATSVAQTISGIGIVMRLNKGNYGVKLNIKTFNLNKADVKKVIGIGLPAGIQNAGNAVAAVLVQAFVNTFGVSFIAANSIVTKIDNFASIPAMAIGTALCSFVGQNIGIGLKSRVKAGINTGIITSVALGALCCIALIATRNILPKAFNTDAEVAQMAAAGLLVTAFISTFHGIDRCLVNAMRGAGKSIVPMITAQFGAFSRIPLVYFMAVNTGRYSGVFYAMLTASTLRMLAIAVYYYFLGGKRAVDNFEPYANVSGDI